MDDDAARIDLLFQKVEDYGKTTLELLQLKAIDKTVDVASSILSQIAIFLVVLLAILTFKIGIALWIGNLVGGYALGFFIVGGLYAIVALVLFKFENVLLTKPLNDAIISKIVKQNN